MKFSTVFTTLLLLGASSVNGQLYNSFINCITSGSVPSGTVNIAGSSSSDSCVSQCLNTNFRYAYYTAQSTNLPGITSGQPGCQCSNTQPPISGFTRTVDTVGDFTCNTPTDYQAYLLRTSNRFDGCSQGGGDKGPLQVANADVDTFEECLTYCVNFNTIYFQVGPSTDSVFCICETDATPQATRCGDDSDNYYTMYRRTPGAVASGGLRKRNRGTYSATFEPGSLGDTSIYHEAPVRRGLTEQKYCPHGLTACNVAGQPGAYECLDTVSELESCGGCVEGEFGSPNSTKGVNCYDAFPNSALGRVTCSSGVCLLY